MSCAPPGKRTSTADPGRGLEELHRVRGIALALVAAGCAHARPPDGARVALETAPRATARLGAARIVLRIVNEGPTPRRIAVDPDALLVAVASPSGQAARCQRPSSAATDCQVAAGESVQIQLDLSRRCELEEPGVYRVEIRHPAGGAKAVVALLLTQWVNPGPLSPAGNTPPLQQRP
jgi:hypothetical protein